jgi:hypothetical protein
VRSCSRNYAPNRPQEISSRDTLSLTQKKEHPTKANVKTYGVPWEILEVASRSSNNSYESRLDEAWRSDLYPNEVFAHLHAEAERERRS